MDEKARIRINLNDREVEIEGSEEFIAKYSNTIDEYLVKIKSEENLSTSRKTKNQEAKSADRSSQEKSDSKIESQGIPESFGEYYNKLPRSAKDVDKILAAGYFLQRTNEKGVFSTRHSGKLLVEQGVKLSNPSASLKSNLSTKKVFKHLGDYKVSETGIDYLKKLMSQDD